MKYMLELSNELRAEVKKEAALLKISMNEFIIMAVIAFLEKEGDGIVSTKKKDTD